MIIKKIAFVVGMITLQSLTMAQSFEWVKNEPVDYNLNPSYPEFTVCFNESASQVINSRIDSISMIYGQYVLSSNQVEARDTNGQVLWSVHLGDSAFVQRIIADASGNIYMAGLFQNTLHFGAADSLSFIQGTFVFQNTFILKFDSQGNLIWKRNITGTWSGYEGIEALAVDPSGNCWYAMTDFFIAKIIRIDSNGNDQTVYTIVNGKRIGNISFDPSGGMFVSGAATSGNFIMNTDTFVVNEQYNMFVARFNPQGQGSWVHFGYDITFQKPMVIADGNGSAFFAGTRFDTTSFNGTIFYNPYLNIDFFAFKIDTLGSISWSLQQPLLGLGPYGNFEPGSNLIVAADASGKYYLGGIQRGPVDWGNGYISSTPMITDRKIAIACIDPAGMMEWVKMGGGNYNNYIHALAVSNSGACYFTGAFSDTAVFDTIILNTTNNYNFAVGKINPVLALGLEDISHEELLLYPNPTKGNLWIPENLLNATLLVIDVAGKKVIEQQIKSRELDLEKLSPGLYSLEFRSDRKVIHSRVVVMN